jgi:HK97 family phage portal protein
MSFLDRVAGLLGDTRATIQDPTVPLTSARVLDWLGGKPTWSGARVNPASGLGMTTVYACIKILAESIAALPLKLYRTTKEGKQQAEKDQRFWLLYDEPNPETSSYVWRETLMGHLLGWGGCWAERQLDGAARTVALWPLLPNHTSIERRGGRRYVRTTVYENEVGVQKLLPAERVLYIPGLGYDGIRGYSPITMAQQAIGLGLAAEEFAARFYANGAHLGIALKTPNKLAPETATALKADFEIMHQGLTQAHRVAVFEQGLDVVRLGIPPADAQFIQTRVHQNRDIAKIYRVPLYKLQDLEHSAVRSNIEHQGIEFVTDVLLPWLVRWEQELNRQLLTREERRGGLFFQFNVDGLLRGDAESRGKWFWQMFQMGAFSTNDILAKEDMPGVGPAGDQRFVPLNLVPLDLASRLAAAGSQEKPPATNGDGKKEELTAEVVRRALPPPASEGVAHAAAGRVRALAARDGLRRIFGRLFAQAVARYSRLENKAISRIAERGRASGDAPKAVAEIGKFYAEFPAAITRDLLPVVESYAEALRAAIEAEVGRISVSGSPLSLADLVTDLAADRVARSQDAVLERLAAGRRLDDFGQQPENDEAAALLVRTGETIAAALYSAAGATDLMWATDGRACADCDDAGGRSLDEVEIGAACECFIVPRLEVGS